MEALEILKGPAVIAFISAVLGAIIGASIKLYTEVYVPRWLEDRRQILITKRKYSNPILKSADALLARLENIIENINSVKGYLFSWDDVPGNDGKRLLKYLRDDYNIGWTESAEIRKSDDGETIHIFEGANSAKITIDEGGEKATLMISDGITHDLIVKKENDKLNIYKGWLRPLTEKDITDIPFRRYYYISTIFCFAQLIGWIEILGKEQSYLDFTKVGETRVFNQYMKLIYDALNYPELSSEHSRPNSKDYWILSHMLRSIGQIMMQRKDGNLYCMDFKTFCEAFKDPKSSEFRVWLFPLSRLIEDLSDDPNDLRWRRLQITYVIVREYINFVDPKHIKSQLKIKDYDEILADPTNVFKAVQKRGETYDLKLEFPDIKCT